MLKMLRDSHLCYLLWCVLKYQFNGRLAGLTSEPLQSLKLFASKETHWRHHYSLLLNKDFVKKMSGDKSANIVPAMLLVPVTGDEALLYNATMAVGEESPAWTKPGLIKAVQHTMESISKRLRKHNIEAQPFPAELEPFMTTPAAASELAARDSDVDSDSAEDTDAILGESDIESDADDDTTRYEAEGRMKKGTNKVCTSRRLTHLYIKTTKGAV
jgi:hypothetical protein